MQRDRTSHGYDRFLTALGLQLMCQRRATQLSRAIEYDALSRSHAACVGHAKIIACPAGVPGQKLPSASTAPPKPTTPSWPEGSRMQQQQPQQQPPVSASALQQVPDSATDNCSLQLSHLMICEGSGNLDILCSTIWRRYAWVASCSAMLGAWLSQNHRGLR